MNDDGRTRIPGEQLAAGLDETLRRPAAQGNDVAGVRVEKEDRTHNRAAGRLLEKPSHSGRLLQRRLKSERLKRLVRNRLFSQWNLVGGRREGLDHHPEEMADVQIGIVLNPVRHQIAAIRPLGREAVQSDIDPFGPRSSKREWRRLWRGTPCRRPRRSSGDGREEASSGCPQANVRGFVLRTTRRFSSGTTSRMSRIGRFSSNTPEIDVLAARDLDRAS